MADDRKPDLRKDAAEPPVDAELFRYLFANNPQPMWIYDQETLRFLEVNDTAVVRYGYSRAEFLCMTLEDIRPPEDVDRLHRALARKSGGYSCLRGWHHRRKDGGIIYVDIHSHEFEYAGRRSTLVVANDVTERVETEQRLQMQTAYFRQLFDNSPQGIVILDAEDKIVEVNHAFEELFGYGLEELRSRELNSVIVPEDKASEATGLSMEVLNDKRVRTETVRRRKDGTPVHVSIIGYPIRVDGKQVGVYGIYHDISERQRVVDEMAYQATHDPLTDLYNRREFERRATALLSANDRRAQQHVMLYIDLDQFKVVNDTCGHQAGDELLRQLGAVLSSHVRDSDTLARLGGDEFGLLLTDCSLPQAELVAEKLIELVNGYPFLWEDKNFSIGASIGIVAMTDGQTFVELMTAADHACYSAKDKGRNRAQVYREDDEDIQVRNGELNWVVRLKQALETGAFQLHYQRIVSTGILSSKRQRYEILLRMREPDGRLVQPGTFIPAAERYGLMQAVDRWVIERVFAAIAEYGHMKDLDQICINLSGLSLSDEKLICYVKQLFDRYGVEPRVVCFELTETAAISNVAKARDFSASMRELGCAIALDDFGSGMSSFSYLKTLQVDYLKIDGSFVRDMAGNPVDYAMVEAINRVGQVMGIQTIAEFVEDAVTLEKLRQLGVNFAQGYAIHRPEIWH